MLCSFSVWITVLPKQTGGRDTTGAPPWCAYRHQARRLNAPRSDCISAQPLPHHCAAASTAHTRTKLSFGAAHDLLMARPEKSPASSGAELFQMRDEDVTISPAHLTA